MLVSTKFPTNSWCPSRSRRYIPRWSTASHTNHSGRSVRKRTRVNFRMLGNAETIGRCRPTWPDRFSTKKQVLAKPISQISPAREAHPTHFRGGSLPKPRRLERQVCGWPKSVSQRTVTRATGVCPDVRPLAYDCNAFMANNLGRILSASVFSHLRPRGDD